MADDYMRQSALAPLALASRAQDHRGEAGAGMVERPFRGMVNLRGKPEDQAFLEAAGKALGIGLPLEPNTINAKDRVMIFWLSPEEWLVITPTDGEAMANTLLAELSGIFCAVTDVSDNYTCIGIEGPEARWMLSKGCPMDLHPREFPVGRCAQTLIGKAPMIIHHVADSEEEDGPSYELYLRRSFAAYAWMFLEEAGRDVGVAVLTR